MLTKIESDRFRHQKICFHQGLNVILGDDNATNSIGKSSLLMVIDFIFGGNSLLDHNSDLVGELGNHAYTATFHFDGQDYRFRRSTDQPRFVFRLDEEMQTSTPLSLEKYSAFLRQAYQLRREDISFRALVGLYFRVWGKENTEEVHRPLHGYKSQSSRECIDNLIKTFGQYSAIQSLSEQLEKAEDEKKALRAAIRNRHLPDVSKRIHDQNVDVIERIEEEIEDIKTHLAQYAANISQLVNRDVLELKEKKDGILAALLTLKGRLNRIGHNISSNRHIKSDYFTGILEYFPDVNTERLVAVEEFHNGVAKLLRSELLDSQRSISQQINALENEVLEIDEGMSKILSSVDQPSAIVDRVYRLSTDWTNAKSQNRSYEKSIALDREIKALEEALSGQKQLVLASIQHTINDTLYTFVGKAFGPDRKAPTLILEEKRYRYEVFEDTGTGVAYSALLMFDLAVFINTNLPFIGHDSLIFKNIENDSLAKLFPLYESTNKQSFIAIDEIDKYGPDASSLLRARAVIQLKDDDVLYVKDWRSKRRDNAN